MNEMIIRENQTFSFPRFWQLLKSDLRINQPKYIRTVAAALGCFVTVAILISVFAINDIGNLSESNAGNPHLADIIETRKMTQLDLYNALSFMIFSVGITIMGSMTFISMNSKSGRISTIMLPASMSEKFWLRFLEYGICGVLVLAMGYILGLIVVGVSFAGSEVILKRFDSLCVVDGTHDVVWFLGIFLGLPVLLGNAFYALGSSIWPRTSWIKTWVCQQAIGVLFLFAGAFGLFKIVSNWINWLDKIDPTSINENAIFWTYVVIFIVLIAGCWTLAWWRFRNTQIVQRFMKK